MSKFKDYLEKIGPINEVLKAIDIFKRLGKLDKQLDMLKNPKSHNEELYDAPRIKSDIDDVQKYLAVVIKNFKDGEYDI